MSIIALIIAIATLFLSIFNSPQTPVSAFKFGSDPETTAKNIIERDLKLVQCGNNNKAYFFQKYSSDYMKNLEFELLEDGKYVAVFWKTKVKDNSIRGYYMLAKNNDGKYVEEKNTANIPEKFLERVEKKWSKYKEDATKASDFDFDDLKD